jgi:hypothetical protein
MKVERDIVGIQYSEHIGSTLHGAINMMLQDSDQIDVIDVYNMQNHSDSDDFFLPDDYRGGGSDYGSSGYGSDSGGSNDNY